MHNSDEFLSPVHIRKVLFMQLNIIKYRRQPNVLSVWCNFVTKEEGVNYLFASLSVFHLLYVGKSLAESQEQLGWKMPRLF